MRGGLLSFMGLCVLITATPGLDMAVVIRSTLRGGTGAGLRTAIGCALGLFVHATVVALGLAGLLLGSEAAFRVVRLTGAALLIGMGALTLWTTWRGGESSDSAPESDVAPGRFAAVGSPFTQGVLTNLTNPKATLFFLAALPQFVPLTGQGSAVTTALGLAVIAVLFSVAGLSLVALLAGRMRRVLQSRRARRTQETLLGAALIGLGVGVAAT